MVSPARASTAQVYDLHEPKKLPKLLKIPAAHHRDASWTGWSSPPVDGAPTPPTAKISRVRVIDSVETALQRRQGHADRSILRSSGDETLLLSEHNACPHCDITLPALSPALFSFNAPSGMCPDCNGLGTKMEVDPGLIVEHPDLSLLDGASRWYGNVRKKKNGWHYNNLQAMADHYGVDLELPWKDLPQKFRDVILWGSGEEKIHFKFENQKTAPGKARANAEERGVGVQHQPPVPPDPVRIHPALVHELHEPAALPGLRRHAPVRRSAPRHRGRANLPRSARA